MADETRQSKILFVFARRLFHAEMKGAQITGHDAMVKGWEEKGESCLAEARELFNVLSKHGVVITEPLNKG